MVPSDFGVLRPADYGDIPIRNIAQRCAQGDADRQQRVLEFLGMLLRPTSSLVPVVAYCKGVVIFPVRRLTEASPRGEIWAIAFGKFMTRRDVDAALWVLGTHLNLPLQKLSAGRYMINEEPITRENFRRW